MVWRWRMSQVPDQHGSHVLRDDAGEAAGARLVMFVISGLTTGVQLRVLLRLVVDADHCAWVS